MEHGVRQEVGDQQNLSILHTDRSGTLRAFSRQTPYCLPHVPSYLPSFRRASGSCQDETNSTYVYLRYLVEISRIDTYPVGLSISKTED